MRGLELKKCPFCGGDAVIVYRQNNYEYTHANYYPLKQGTVMCSVCGLRLPRFWSAECAVAVWNRRRA